MLKNGRTKTPTVHNPTNFDPQDYEVVDYLDNNRPVFYGDGPEHEQAVAFWEADMLRALGPDWRAKVHHCVHCGNGSVRWITAVEHKPTSERVVFGAVCTARLGFADKHAFKLAQLQARAEARKVRFTVWTKRQEFLAAHPGLDAAFDSKNTFVQDVMRKLDQYGSLSDAQVNAVFAAVKREAEYAVRRAAETVEVKGQAPSGRQTVTGTVVSLKWHDNDFGGAMKMVVKLENNSRVWLTAPSKETLKRGDLVTVTATFEVSRDDKSFAFGKRPHLVSRVASGQEVSA